MKCTPSGFSPDYLIKIAMQGSKLAKLVWDGISVLVLSMFWLLRCAFLSIMSMPTAAFEHPFWKLKKRLSHLKPSKEVNCCVDVARS